MGQGWEIPVTLPDRRFASADSALLRDLFRENYTRFFGRPIDGLEDLEIVVVTWSVKMQDRQGEPERHTLRLAGAPAEAATTRPVFDPVGGAMLYSAVHDRTQLAAGTLIVGPAIIVERETTTVVTSTFDAVIQDDGSILLVRKGAPR